MNRAIRYYSNSQQNHLQYNYQMQPYSRPSNLNAIRFQQEKQNFHIQNDFEQNRIINQDNQFIEQNRDNEFIEQNRTNIQQHNNVQEITRDFINNNNNNINNDQNQNTQKFEFTEQYLRPIYLFAILEQVIAIILITIFYYIKSLQQYLIDQNTLQLNNITLYCMFIPLFVLYFIIFIIYRGSKNPLEESNKIAILTHTLIFQYIMICFGIVQFKTLNQGFLYVQITESHIVLILIVFFVRPIQSFNLRRYFLIVIVSTIILVLFMSNFFQDLKFWWMFGVPVIAYFLSLKFQIWFWNDASQRLVLIHNSLSQMMIFVFMILSLFE